MTSKLDMSLGTIIQSRSSDRQTRRSKLRSQPYSVGGRNPNVPARDRLDLATMNPMLPILQQFAMPFTPVFSVPLSQLGNLSINMNPTTIPSFNFAVPSLQNASKNGKLSFTDVSGLAFVDIKVGSTSNPKHVAGSIAHNIRQGTKPVVLAIGPASLNQAVKAMCIARQYLQNDNLDFTALPEFRHEERQAVSFMLSKVPGRRSPPLSTSTSSSTGASFDGQPAVPMKADDSGSEIAPTSAPSDSASSSSTGNSADTDAPDENSTELRVAHTSEPSIVAGSIAGKIREKLNVSLVAVGPGSVSVTIRAMTIARRYLERDSLDCSFKSSFIHLDMLDGQRSGIKFVLLVITKNVSFL